MTHVWTRIRETIEQHGSAGLVSVIGVAGSAPRESGARLVVRPDGGFFGTIGGGRLEYEALEAACTALAAGRGKAQFRDWPLGPNLGQCCGGVVTTLTETFDVEDLAMVRRFEEAEISGVFVANGRLDHDGRITRAFSTHTEPDNCVGRASADKKVPFSERFGEARRPLLLFGAGHVGRSLVLALAPLPFAVRWIDSRPDEFPRHVPSNVVTVITDAPERELALAPGGAFVIVMTHSHPLDFDITISALKRGTFDFVGLIGSRTKRARCASLARQMSVAEALIDRLVCPIGILQIRGKEPAVIAAAVAAQILIVNEGASAPPRNKAIQSI